MGYNLPWMGLGKRIIGQFYKRKNKRWKLYDMNEQKQVEGVILYLKGSLPWVSKHINTRRCDLVTDRVTSVDHLQTTRLLTYFIYHSRLTCEIKWQRPTKRGCSNDRETSFWCRNRGEGSCLEWFSDVTLHELYILTQTSFPWRLFYFINCIFNISST